MSPERQRVVIAELCPGLSFGIVGPGEPEVWKWPSGAVTGEPLNDLNAIHEAEKRIPASDRHDWYLRLSMIVERERRMASVPGWLVPTATATQRAEALIRTFNKWEDSK